MFLWPRQKYKNTAGHARPSPRGAGCGKARVTGASFPLDTHINVGVHALSSGEVELVSPQIKIVSLPVDTPPPAQGCRTAIRSPSAVPAKLLC